MKFIKISILILVIISQYSCKKELPFPDLDSETLLVVNAELNPQKPIMLHLSSSCHVSDSLCSFPNITDAQVTISEDGSNDKISLDHKGNGIYGKDNFQVNSGSQYQLEVVQQNNSLAAKTKIPSQVSCSFISKEELVYEGAATWSFNIEIEDNPDEENYYILEGYIDILDGYHSNGEEEVNGYLVPHTAHYSNDPNAENKSITSGFDYISYPLRKVFLPDHNFNGQSYPSQFAIRDMDALRSEFEQFQAHVFVKSVNREMYEYHKSLAKYQLNIGNLFAEPEQIYSNIENGLGNFGAYTQQEFVVNLPISEYRLPSDIMVTNNGCTGSCEVGFSTNGGPKLNYHWDFGDGNTSTEANPVHTFEAAGEFGVILSFLGSPGDFHTSEVLVKIR